MISVENLKAAGRSLAVVEGALSQARIAAAKGNFECRVENLSAADEVLIFNELSAPEQAFKVEISAKGYVDISWKDATYVTRGHHVAAAGAGALTRLAMLSDKERDLIEEAIAAVVGPKVQKGATELSLSDTLRKVAAHLPGSNPGRWATQIDNLIRANVDAWKAEGLELELS